MSQQLDTIQVHYVHAGINIDIHMLSVDIIFSTIKKAACSFSSGHSSSYSKRQQGTYSLEIE